MTADVNRSILHCKYRLLILHSMNPHTYLKIKVISTITDLITMAEKENEIFCRDH